MFKRVVRFTNPICLPTSDGSPIFFRTLPLEGVSLLLGDPLWRIEGGAEIDRQPLRRISKG